MANDLSRADKISATMKARGLNNFAKWQAKMKAEGKMKSDYPTFEKNGDLAELIGVVLGDGHIYSFPRTEELSIFSNSNNPGFIKRYSDLVEKIFSRKPVLRDHHGGGNCTRIRIYEKHISKRLGIPVSPRGPKTIVVPGWIFRNKNYIVRYLRGLYEAEGCFCYHPATSTHKALFSNRNVSMLSNVETLLSKLGFHPHKGRYMIQLSRKEEVARFKDLIEFRKY